MTEQLVGSPCDRSRLRVQTGVVGRDREDSMDVPDLVQARIDCVQEVLFTQFVLRTADGLVNGHAGFSLPGVNDERRSVENVFLSACSRYGASV